MGQMELARNGNRPRLFGTPEVTESRRYGDNRGLGGVRVGERRPGAGNIWLLFVKSLVRNVVLRIKG